MSYPDRMRSLYIDDIPGIQYISIKVQDLQKEHIKNQYTGKDMMNKFLDLQEILKNNQHLMIGILPQKKHASL